MKLGAFSVSLNVKDIVVSKEFYEALGFEIFAGDITQNWLIMRNENTVIGLFQGVFENNVLTFNPGWDQDCNTLDSFDDIRTIQKHLKSKGIKLESEADEASAGPAYCVIIDPDGNPIFFDQHV